MECGTWGRCQDVALPDGRASNSDGDVLAPTLTGGASQMTPLRGAGRPLRGVGRSIRDRSSACSSASCDGAFEREPAIRRYLSGPTQSVGSRCEAASAAKLHPPRSGALWLAQPVRVGIR